MHDESDLPPPSTPNHASNCWPTSSSNHDDPPMTSPFLASASIPGHGEIHLTCTPPQTPRLKTCSYQYPLKLVAPDPLYAEDERLIHTVYLLSYGGGLVAGDTVNLRITIDPSARLVLLTQGSTKIFISDSPSLVTTQSLNVHIAAGAALCYLPDPVQPFTQSAFEQAQIYHLPALHCANLCVLDWACRGRSARGENWNVWRYASKNEVWLAPLDGGKKRLLIRDNVILEEGTAAADDGGFSGRMDQLGAFGTLILHGPLFSTLARFFMDEFEELPRIGNRNWDNEVLAASARTRRAAQETRDGFLWTAASVRGFVLVKFGAREVEGVKKWLLGMLREEGSVERLFGERATLCLRS